MKKLESVLKEDGARELKNILVDVKKAVDDCEKEIKKAGAVFDSDVLATDLYDRLADAVLQLKNLF